MKTKIESEPVHNMNPAQYDADEFARRMNSPDLRPFFIVPRAATAKQRREVRLSDFAANLLNIKPKKEE